MFRKTLTALAAAACLAACCGVRQADAGWGSGGGCAPAAFGPVGPPAFVMPLLPPPPPPPPPVVWVNVGDQVDLVQGGVQLGAWDGEVFRYRNGSGWSEPCQPPLPPPAGYRITVRKVAPPRSGEGVVPDHDTSCAPCGPKTPAPAKKMGRGCGHASCGRRCCDCDPDACVCGDDHRCGPGCTCKPKPAAEAPIFGVDVEKLAHSRHANSVNGRPVSREAAIKAIEEGVPDDAGRPRLTLIGAKEDCQRVLKDLAGDPALKPYADKYLVQDYRPDNWAVKCGFKTDGSPVIYAQDAAGKVLHRQDDYEGGAQALATALRKADPAYDPKADPDKRKADPVSDALAQAVDYLKTLPPAYWVGGLVIALLAWQNYKNKKV
jgi:hypothetical protein